MGDTTDITHEPPVEFSTDPTRYRHWEVAYDGPIARVAMNVDPEAPLRPGYELKLNSYDLGVDIELADIVQRMRFEHPEVHVVVLSSANDRVFCAGACIHMLSRSTHAWKVNFCKFTNETRCAIEDADAHSEQIWIAACNGTTAGGGYELALACREIYLQDDGNSAVSFPEVPLLAVLPGTGGLTRLVDKRKVRRDHADVFSTTAEGIRGRRAVDWNLVDGIFPRSRFAQSVDQRAAELVGTRDPSSTQGQRRGVRLEPLDVDVAASRRTYSCVELTWDDASRVAQLVVRAPTADDVAVVERGGEAMRDAGSGVWGLRAYRELDDALLHLRTNLDEIGLLLIRAVGDPAQVLAYDEALLAAREHWFVREVILHMARTLRRLDLTSRSVFAMADRGTAFVGNLLELALAADRLYLLDDPDQPVQLGLSAINAGVLPMSHGWARLQARFAREPERYAEVSARRGLLDAQAADDAGLPTIVLDEIDWDDDTRVAVEERVSLSPDALTGMEANLRFAGPETATSKIFARLTAWQNWVFVRPNATGPEGALTLYGMPTRPSFDWRRV
ncbi:MAG: benzoyl-CoA-dihydrodiol lyase [Myxococcales bacterium FL481]|nr:MAG: benzoyl-CoA-dihydrodiol lyase [Myxococcales bacterium FL481]